jgi:hypothetical protein
VKHAIISYTESMSAYKLPDLKAGVYRHYKRHLYLVLGYGHDSNYEGRDVVVYVGLELDDAKTGPRLAVRTVEDFFATVQPDGSNERVRRFTYVGPSWEGSRKSA